MNVSAVYTPVLLMCVFFHKIIVNIVAAAYNKVWHMSRENTAIINRYFLIFFNRLTTFLMMPFLNWKFFFSKYASCI